MKFNVLLNSLEKIQTFVKAANGTSCDIDIVSGRYYLDAKSILGIMSCNVSAPMTVVIHSDDMKEIEGFKEKITSFLYEL